MDPIYDEMATRKYSRTRVQTGRRRTPTPANNEPTDEAIKQLLEELDERIGQPRDEQQN